MRWTRYHDIIGASLSEPATSPHCGCAVCVYNIHVLYTCIYIDVYMYVYRWYDSHSVNVWAIYVRALGVDPKNEAKCVLQQVL